MGVFQRNEVDARIVLSIDGISREYDKVESAEKLAMIAEARNHLSTAQMMDSARYLLNTVNVLLTFSMIAAVGYFLAMAVSG